MNFALELYFLTGVMLGFELVETEEGERVVVVDLLFIRFLFYY